MEQKAGSYQNKRGKVMARWMMIKAGGCNPGAETWIEEVGGGYNVVIVIPFLTRCAAEETLKSIELDGKPKEQGAKEATK